MARYFLTLSYDGSDFNGWQVQDNTPNTVQQLLEEKISMLLKERISLTGCGRTDTGVNARNFVAHFDSLSATLAAEKRHLLYKINTVLPAGIAVHDLTPVKSNAHARFDAQQRVYHYFISRQKNPFRGRYCWFVFGDLDFDRMNAAAMKLCVHEDFTSFSKHHTQTKTNRCRISKAIWQKSGEYEYRFTIVADRFLRGMVRAIVGTLVLAGRGKITTDEFEQIIMARDRTKAGPNAPANALFLTGVSYPENIYN